MTVSQTTTAPLPKLNAVGALVDRRISGLQARLLAEHADPNAISALARLRRGVGRKPGELLDILDYTVLDDALYEASQKEVERHEVAVHVAMTLYAVHQQSRGEAMHQRGWGLGRALRALHVGDAKDMPDPLVRRFRMLGTSSTLNELIYHLRGAVQLLRAGTSQTPRRPVPLDYGLLADQLVAWQRGQTSRVQLAWGRDFYRTQPSDAQPDA